MFITILKKIANIFARSTRTHYQDLEKQCSFYRQFGDTSNSSYVECSFVHYQCQNFLYGKLYKLFMNLSSFFILVPYLLSKRFRKVEKGEPVKSVYIDDGVSSDIIPEIALEKYGDVHSIPFSEVSCLKKEDMAFLFGIYKQYPFSFYFIFKIALKIAMYRGIIEKYNPENIFCYTEFSFASQVATDYCQQHGIRHINVMHGEVFSSIYEVNSRFHEYYVWDEHYKKLLTKLGATPSQFIIAIPAFMKIDTTEPPVYDYKFYAGAETESELKTIYSNLLKLQDKGYQVLFRPHPRMTDGNHVANIFKEIAVEPFETPIETSIAQTSGIISLSSSVNFQGFINGKTIFLDDVTNAKKYQFLFDLDYIMCHNPHQKFSDLLKE